MELLFSIAFFILGAIIASFVGVIAEHIHTGQAWWKGRSHCNSCRRVLGPLDLVPVLSWLLSLGRCRTCKSRVPLTYLLIEIALGSAFAFSYLSLGLSFGLALFLIAIAVLAFIVLYDLRHTIVPDVGSWSLIVLGLLFSFVQASDLASFGYAVLAAGLIGFGFFLVYALSRGRAMGLGDAPVAFALSLLVAPYALAGVLFSFWVGALVGVGILFARPGGPKMGIEVPFVPFMAVGFLLAYFIQWNPLTFILF